MSGDEVQEGNDVIVVEHACLVIKVAQGTGLGAMKVITGVTCCEAGLCSGLEHGLDAAVEREED